MLEKNILKAFTQQHSLQAFIIINERDITIMDTQKNIVRRRPRLFVALASFTVLVSKCHTVTAYSSRVLTSSVVNRGPFIIRNSQLSSRKSLKRRSMNLYSYVETNVQDLPDIQAVISHYGVKLGTDENISYTTEDGKFYNLSAIEESKALQAVRKATDLLQIQAKLHAKLGKPPAMKAWAKAAGINEKYLSQTLTVGMAAKRLIVATNIPLVYGIVYKQYSKRLARDALQLTVDDLIQDGILGLAHAAELYDVERSGGARFRTYAWYWIKAYINQGIMSGGYSMRMPRRATETYDTAYRTLLAKNNRAPTEDEIALHMGISTEELYRKYMLPKSKALSLDRQNSDGSDLHFVIEDHSNDSDSEEEILKSFMRDALDKVLSPREKELLSLRFGLEDGRSRTLKECSKSTLMSLEATRTLLKSSITKLRAHIAMQNHKLQDSVMC